MFRELLRRRLESGIFTTEDSVRYMLFVALMREGNVQPESIVLEYPHPAIPGAELDTWAPAFDGRTLAIEFKYDRNASNGPQRAGAVFADIRRLALIEESNTQRLFIYLTSWEMASYFENPQNGLADFYGLESGRVIRLTPEYFGKRSATLRNAIGGEFEAEVVGMFSANLPQRHSLRVWDIRQTK
jgi:hypothetical protein